MRLSDNRFPYLQKSRVVSILVVTSLILAQPFVHADTGKDFVPSASPLVTEGYSQLEGGQSAKALVAFEQALQADAKNLSARLGQAMIYAEQERHQEAFASYDLIVQHFPKHAFAWNGRGLAAFNLEDFDTALTSFQMATADQPVNGFFYESLAWTQMCRGEFVDAAESAKKASLMYSRKGETSAYPLLIAYFSYHESGDAQNALRTLAYANKNKPVNQWPAPVIDYLSEKIGEADLISFVTNPAEETEAHTYIGLYLRLLGETDAADQHLQWVSQNGNAQVFEYTLARALNLQNNVASAIR
ncbi:MAG: tetratricopeptide repeat protein [Opitutae bacterium]|jgi:tetratricopeptide (TPR) repeat protein|nr:tetratricopeptide repeat protein [Opitutae bacterium]